MTINLDKDKLIIDAMLAGLGARVLGVNPEEAIYWTNFNPEYLKQYINQLEQAQSRVDELEEENQILREMLAINYAGNHLYGDDGELQDNRHPIMIDFRRDSAIEIKNKIMERGCIAYAEALSNQEQQEQEGGE